MIRNGFRAVCWECDRQGDKAEKDGCAVVSINGTNAYGDREARILTMCGPCRRSCRGRCNLHPKHRAPKK